MADLPNWATWVVGSIIGFAVAWGSIRSSVATLQRQMEEMNLEFHEMRQILSDLRESVVRLQAVFDAEKEFRR